MMNSIKNLVKRIPGAEKVAHALGLAPDSLKQRMFLLELLPKNSIGVEIGVHLGDFSEKILQIVQPKEFHLIDPWKHETSDIYGEALYGGRAREGQAEMDRRYANVCARFAEPIGQNKVKVHRSYSTDVLGQFPDDYFDWIYIDGNHLYEYVKKDLELSFRKTKTGGFVAGDDYADAGWWEDGVKKAVDEYAKNPSARLVEIRSGQFVFCKQGQG